MSFHEVSKKTAMCFTNIAASLRGAFQLLLRKLPQQFVNVIAAGFGIPRK